MTVNIKVGFLYLILINGVKIANFVVVIRRENVLKFNNIRWMIFYNIKKSCCSNMIFNWIEYNTSDALKEFRSFQF